MKQLFALLLLIGSACAVAQPTGRIAAVENGLRGPVIVAGEPVVTQSLADRMKHYNVPGVSIAVIDRGDIAWAKGYGFARAGRAVTPATRFSTGSVSKAVTAVAAMRLVDRGALSLDEDVNRVLVGWKVPDSPLSAGELVTLRRLLSHTAGLSVPAFWPGYEPGARLPTNIQILNGEPPAMNKPVVIERRPGSEWQYAGGGYQVVQQLLTENMGTDFQALMQTLLFRPLSMTHSTFEQIPPAAAAATYATAHDQQGKELPSDWMLMPEMAAAGLWTTASDLARLAIKLQEAFRGKANAFMSAKTAREMFTPQAIRPADNWGLGFVLNGQGRALRFDHGGDNPGFKAIVIAYPETGQGAVILTNGDGGERLYREILFAIAATYHWPDYGPTIKTRVRVDPSALERVQGTYTLEEQPDLRLVVSPRAESLTLRIIRPGNEREVELLPSSAGRYFRRDIDFEMQFAQGPTPSQVTIIQDGQSFTATRVTDNRDRR